MFNIFAIEKREYPDDNYDNAYYIHTQEFPHLIKISKDLYDMISQTDTKELDILPSMIKVSRYKGQVYYTFQKKGE